MANELYRRIKLLGFRFQTTPMKYAGIAVANNNNDVLMFSTSVKALITIKITKMMIKMTGIAIGTFNGRSRFGSLKRRTMRPTAAKRIPKQRKCQTEIIINNQMSKKISLQIQLIMPTQIINLPMFDMKKRKMKLRIISQRMAIIGTFVS